MKKADLQKSLARREMVEQLAHSTLSIKRACQLVGLSRAADPLRTGGLEALQTISMIAAFPCMMLGIFRAASRLKSLRDEMRQAVLHNAMMRERILRMLEEQRGPIPDCYAH